MREPRVGDVSPHSYEGRIESVQEIANGIFEVCVSGPKPKTALWVAEMWHSHLPFALYHYESEYALEPRYWHYEPTATMIKLALLRCDRAEFDRVNSEHGNNDNWIALRPMALDNIED